MGNKFRKQGWILAVLCCVQEEERGGLEGSEKAMPREVLRLVGLEDREGCPWQGGGMTPSGWW